MDNQRGKEESEAEELRSPGGAVIYRAVLKEGFDELARPSSALFWSGLAAGLSMGASLIAEGLLRRYLPPGEWQPLIAKLGYSIGFLIVILGRQQLFTENTLTPILPLLKERTKRVFREVMRLWAVVLASNMLGCIAVAWVAQSSNAFEPAVREHFSQIGMEALGG